MTEKNELGTLNGCFIPCLLTILGATLFLRLGFGVGMMGFSGCLGILLYAEWLSYTTVSSFSAIAANGNNSGGGAYYMISRALGLPFGAASGLLFWISYCMNASFNCAAFTSVFQATVFDEDSWWYTGYAPTLIISSITMIPLCGIAFNGAGMFAQVNGIVFIGLFIGCVVSVYSLYFTDEKYTDLPVAGETYSGFSFARVQENMWADPVVKESQCGGVCNLRFVFADIFPAVVGMMEGLNLIGDLKDPVYSVPVGTYAAVSVALVVYILIMLGQAGTVNRIGLQYDLNIMQHATIGGGSYVILGVVTATLSTVLGSLFGASRILQAMARDNVFPGIARFAWGTPQGDEPQPAVVMSYIVAQLFLLFGDLDAIAPLLTISFLLTYSLTDFSCFLLEYFQKEFFNPVFKFYSWQTSLFNSFVIVCTMFYLSVYQTIVAFAVFFIALFCTRMQLQSGIARRASAVLEPAKGEKGG